MKLSFRITNGETPAFGGFIQGSAITRKIKRQMNRRYRQEQKKITEEDYEKDM